LASIANDYPGDDAMKLFRKEFVFTSYWLGNPPQTKSNSWSGKREFLKSSVMDFCRSFPVQLPANYAMSLTR